MRISIIGILASLVACGGGGSSEGPVDAGIHEGAAASVADAEVEGSPAATSDAGTSTSDAGTPSGSPPPIQAAVLYATYAGGAGDQYIQNVGFDTMGRPFGTGASGFTITYDPTTATGSLNGSVTDTSDIATFMVKPDLPGGGLTTQKLQDTRNGQTYTWGTHPNVANGSAVCHNLMCGGGICTGGAPPAAFLQMAFVDSSSGWKNWDFSWQACLDACVVADSRAYDLWPSVNGEIAGLLWTDGGDTPLMYDPKDVSQPATFLKGSFGTSPGGMGTLWFRIDPATGTVLSGTFLATHAAFHAHDAWGRVYIAKAIGQRYGDPNPDNPNENFPSNPYGAFADSSNAVGLTVLRPDLKRPEVDFYLGGNPGTCGDAGAPQNLFGGIALRDNMLVLGGTTCATDFKTTANAVQKQNGGGQDGIFVVMKLW